MIAAAKWGWRILVGLSGLLVLNGAALYVVIVETQVEQTLGLLLAAFGAVSLAVSLEGLRHGTRWAWTTTWVVVGSLTALGVHMVRGDRLDLVLTYFFLAAVALAGQLLAGRSLQR